MLVQPQTVVVNLHMELTSEKFAVVWNIAWCLCDNRAFLM